MAELPWGLIVGLGATGILMALLSSLVGMKPKVENPAWWGLYAVWIVIVVMTGTATPFRTLLTASILAGILHASTQSILFEQYKSNNPWHAERMKGSRGKHTFQFLAMGLGVGAVMGAIVGGIAYGLMRLL